MGQFPKTESDFRAQCELAIELLRQALAGAGEIVKNAENATDRIEFVCDPKNADFIEPDLVGYYTCSLDDLAHSIDINVPKLSALLIAAIGLVAEIERSNLKSSGSIDCE